MRILAFLAHMTPNLDHAPSYETNLKGPCQANPQVPIQTDPITGIKRPNFLSTSTPDLHIGDTSRQAPVMKNKDHGCPPPAHFVGTLLLVIPSRRSSHQSLSVT